MPLAARACVAVLLTVCYYLLALGIAAGLLVAAVAEPLLLHRISPRLSVLCVLGAGAILWSALPRRQRFDIPGPPLDLARNPRLGALLRDVARRVGEPEPRHVYATVGVNAGAYQEGGLFGLGATRKLAIGLPLLQVLTIPELRAVLAHELAHHHRGDTILGAWTFRTRLAIERTLTTVDARLHLPFHAYGLLFLRFTAAVSRAQERSADALAARVAGAGPMATALGKLHAGTVAFDVYWHDVYTPVINAGLEPPLMEGFAHYLAQGSPMAAPVPVRTGPYDTHPPLTERIAALAAMPSRPVADSGAPALELLHNVSGLERALLERLLRPGPGLRPVRWEQVGADLALPLWREHLDEHRALLAGLSIESLPARARQAASLGYRVRGASESGAADWPQRAGVELLAMALGARLADDGWSVHAMPGEPITLRRGGWVLDPMRMVGLMAGGEINEEAWGRWLGEVSAEALPMGI